LVLVLPVGSGARKQEFEMKKTGRMNRRHFLQSAASTAAFAAACSNPRRQGRALLEAELKTLEAICEQIIPADQDHGAAWAGVANFIDRQLAGFYKEHRQAYRSFIADADQRAGGDFARVPPERQFEILSAIEKDDSKKAVFALIVSHTMQGFYGNPRHGGNRDYCSWRMLGVTASPVRGRDQYDLNRGGPA
jgi:gluconate 2-dehydrogenase gamma chain